MKTYKIHLIRHGLTEGNLKQQYIGKTDLPLAGVGVTQLQRLKEEVDYPRVDKVYSSPMLRCLQTAHILYPGRDVQTVDKMREIDFGEFEGKTANELEALPSYADWAAGRINAAPGGEDNTEFAKRLCVGLNEIVRDMMNEGAEHAAVIMHGGAIMMLLSACALPRKSMVEWTCSSGSGYSILVTPSLYHSGGVVEVIDYI
ncbi:MAG: histidine phosphatase family protein [Acutalibacteraceae bacterium]|nr:histidine phosphatase family protein [Acutalibacteraceae bacterium]